MKKFLCLIMVFAVLITITACKSNTDKKENKTTTTNSVEDVVVTIERNNYPLNTEKIIAIWQNNGDEEIGLGYAFELEKETDGKFESVKPESEVLFDLPLIKLSKNERKEIKYSINNYKLESGTYRIKTEYIKNKKQIPIYCEFILK